MGGVVNLVSRRPTDTPTADLLFNRSSRGGTDAVAFLSGPLRGRFGATLLAGAHGQTQNDVDDDGWADIPDMPAANCDRGCSGTTTRDVRHSSRPEQASSPEPAEPFAAPSCGPPAAPTGSRSIRSGSMSAVWRTRWQATTSSPHAAVQRGRHTITSSATSWKRTSTIRLSLRPPSAGGLADTPWSQAVHSRECRSGLHAYRVLVYVHDPRCVPPGRRRSRTLAVRVRECARRPSQRLRHTPQPAGLGAVPERTVVAPPLCRRRVLPRNATH